MVTYCTKGGYCGIQIPLNLNMVLGWGGKGQECSGIFKIVVIFLHLLKNARDDNDGNGSGRVSWRLCQLEGSKLNSSLNGRD